MTKSWHTRLATLAAMTDEALAAAWDAVHENTPAGWYVGRPGYVDRYRIEVTKQEVRLRRR